MHFGRQNGARISLGTSWGTHGSPKWPPERPGVTFGWMTGSALGLPRVMDVVSVAIKGGGAGGGAVPVLPESIRVDFIGSFFHTFFVLHFRTRLKNTRF